MANIMRLGGGSGGGGAKIGVTLNDDGTQNLFITETGDLPDLAAVTADADAEAEDVLYGKTFYSMGVKKVGSQTFAPALLWENPDPTVAFPAQVVTLPTGYSAHFVEYAEGYSDSSRERFGIAYLPFSSIEQISGIGTSKSSSTSLRSVQRIINSCADGYIDFGKGFLNGASGGAIYAIPIRIWGANFTL